jgi:hypothetical protein
MAKVVTYEELKAHSTKDSLYVLIHGEGEHREACQTVSVW